MGFRGEKTTHLKLLENVGVGRVLRSNLAELLHFAEE